MPNSPTVINHPLIQDSLTHLRDQGTPLEKFRLHSDKLCSLLLYEVMADLVTETVTINTPLTTTPSQKLASDVVIVPVLRAGLAMLPGALQLLPKARIGFVGLERDEKTAQAAEYYWKVPTITTQTTVIITDPMLATGGSSAHVIRRITELQPAEIRLVSVIGAPEGISMIQQSFSAVNIYLAQLDSHLNSNKYIVPGLGDYGDRYFGT